MDSGLSGTTCPYLCTLTESGKSAPGVDYPSLENQCLVQPVAESVLLTDQATFCLSSGYKHCPKFAAYGVSSGRDTAGATAGSQTSTYSTATSDQVQYAIEEIEATLEQERRADAKKRKQWGWIGLAAIFLSVLICGGLFAAYVGWRLVTADDQIAQAGSVTTLEQTAAKAAAPFYLVVTATSDAPSSNSTGAVPAQSDNSSPSQQEIPEYPAAVTATPSEPISAQGAGSVGSVQGVVKPSEVIVQPVTSSPPPNVYLEVPTRRPTPILDIAITIPTEETSTPTPTLTPTPLGTPVVLFAAEDTELESGKCTKVSWNVENVRAVYYENLGVDGHGEKKECIRDKPGDYVLTVVLPSGATQYYTVTVGLVVPTATPRPTSTFAPTPVPSPTWTPVVPTKTPTPDMQYGVSLNSGTGDSTACAAGGTCNIELRVTNTSLGIDDLSIRFEQSGDYPASLCRLDGVCSTSKLTLVSVGPGNTALVLLQVEVPTSAKGQSTRYVMKAVSERSNGVATSDALSIEVTGE